jgi:hypothetical protein
MKTLLALTVALTTLTPCVGWSLSSETPPAKDPMIITADDPNSHVLLNQVASGPLITKDDVLEFIKLKDQVGRVMSFYVDTNTPIYDEFNRRIAFRDLEAGQNVNVEYQRDSYTVSQINRVPG